MISMIRIRAWHVVAALVLATAIVAGVIATAANDAASKPVTAGVPLSAPAQEPIQAYDSYKGWGQVDYDYGNGDLPLVGGRAQLAWQWYPNYGWYQRSRSGGTRVYIWPFAKGWVWTWTQDTGWYAMQTKSVIIGYRSIAIAT